MKVLVTGANGHLGFNLTRALLERGHTVRVSVRALRDDRTARLRDLPNAELVEADVTRPDDLRAAVDGIEIVFHAAAVYSFFPERGESDLLRSNIDGAANAVRAAKDAGVRKLVLTSSVFALPWTRPGEPPSTEANWNTDFRVPYVRAKTMAERRAWELARELGVNLVTVLPGAIGGPGFVRNTPSLDVLEGIMKGAMRFGAPNTSLPYVDVRDVAAAHALAAEKDCSGRFIACNDVLPSFLELTAEMHAIDASIPRARTLIPDVALPLAPLIDRLNSRLLGTPRVMTPEFVSSMRGRVSNYSNARAKRGLGWTQSVPLRDSLRDTIAAFRERDRSRIGPLDRKGRAQDLSAEPV